MQTTLKFQTLIELFNESFGRIRQADREYLEIVRRQREEKLTFEALKAGAQDFALWLTRARDIRIKDKIAILGKNRADWDVALWGIILAGAVPVLIDPERPVDRCKETPHFYGHSSDCYGRRLSRRRFPTGTQRVCLQPWIWSN